LILRSYPFYGLYYYETGKTAAYYRLSSISCVFHSCVVQHSMSFHGMRNCTYSDYRNVLIFPSALCTYQALWWYLLSS